MPSNSKHLRLVHFVDGSPLIALGGAARHYPILVDAMDNSTTKRALVRSFVRGIVRTGLLAPLATRLSPTQVPGLRDLLAAVRNDGRQPSAWSVSFPRARDRTRRRYVLVLDAHGKPAAFAKISLAPAADAPLFEREHRLLQRLSSSPLQGWRVPEPLGLTTSDDHSMIVMEALPTKRHNVTWSTTRASLPLAPSRPTRPTAWPAWVEEGLHLPMSASFAARVRQALDDGLDVGLIHGDIRPQNTVATAGHRWLFDWEFGCIDGPANCDPVVAMLNELSWSKPRITSARLRDHVDSWAGREGGPGRPATFLALLYLGTVKHSFAGRLMQLSWPSRPRIGGTHVSDSGPGAKSYRDQFTSNSQSTDYDAVEYAPDSWSSILWEVEQALLRDLLGTRDFVPNRARYLDFACGTGRVTRLVAPHFDLTVGLDISEAMLARARSQQPDATFIQADVVNDPHEVDGVFDLVTAFRFVLNADPEDRLPVLQWVRSRLRDETSRVIINNHGNLWSHKAIVSGLRRMRDPQRRTSGNVLSHREVAQLVTRAGFAIVSRHGTGHLGGTALQALGPATMRRIQHALDGLPLIERVGENQIYVLAPR